MRVRTGRFRGARCQGTIVQGNPLLPHGRALLMPHCVRRARWTLRLPAMRPYPMRLRVARLLSSRAIPRAGRGAPPCTRPFPLFPGALPYPLPNTTSLTFGIVRQITPLFRHPASLERYIMGLLTDLVGACSRWSGSWSTAWSSAGCVRNSGQICF
jgi:hypothetical protein